MRCDVAVCDNEADYAVIMVDGETNDEGIAECDEIAFWCASCCKKFPSMSKTKRSLKCEICKGKGHYMVNNGPDDVDHEVCPHCEGKGGGV